MCAHDILAEILDTSTLVLGPIHVICSKSWMAKATCLRQAICESTGRLLGRWEMSSQSMHVRRHLGFPH